MSLKTRILQSIPRSRVDFEKKKIPFFLLTLTLLIAALIIGRISFSIYQYVTKFTFQDLVGMLSSQLQEDEKHRTNILLLGAGGGEHDGADLTDTILIASLHHEKKTVSVLSIPRDLWLDLPGYGSSRINKIYEILKKKYGSAQALDILRKGVENITNLSVPYVLKVDFEAFREVVDTVGGVEVMVEKSIVDTEYPNEQENGYTTFTLDSGLQHLDGKKALQYVRSRHSTSDFDRSQRQQKVLQALKAKAESREFSSSPLFIKSLFDDISSHLDTNLKITELLSLASFMKSIPSNHIVTSVIRDNETIEQGSFLYTPDRELYGGAFVLVPIGESYQPLQRFISFLFETPEFFQERASIELLNGTAHPNLAGDMGKMLIPYGFHVDRYGNALRPHNKPYQVTSFQSSNPEKTPMTEKIIKTFFPQSVKLGKSSSVSKESNADVTIIIGEDYFEKNSTLSP